MSSVKASSKMTYNLRPTPQRVAASLRKKAEAETQSAAIASYNFQVAEIDRRHKELNDAINSMRRARGLWML